MFRHLKRNYLAHGIEGGLYMAGMAFISVAVILPRMVSSLGGPDWAVAATPMIATVGFMVTPLFTAHHIERLTSHKPLLLVLGIFQRLPYLITGLLLWFKADSLGDMAWILAILCPMISGVVGGLSISAWQELVANTIPAERRSSLVAMRNIIGVLAGVLSGLAVHKMLNIWPGPRGYALLHLAAFVFVSGSYLFFTAIRETPNPRPPVTNRLSLIASLKLMPELVRAHKAVKVYLLDLMLASSPNIMLPFMSIYAQGRLNETDAYVGILSSLQMAGGICGSIMAGWLGDRHGPKLSLWISRFCWIAVCLWPLTASSRIEFWFIFFISGMGLYFRMTGNQAMTLGIVPLENRIRYLSITSGVTLIGMMVASGLSWQLSSMNFSIVCIVTLVFQLAGMAVLRKLPNLPPKS